MPTISDLRQQAATIKNATQVGENTATRVGTTFETIADLLEGMGGVANVSTIDIGEIDTLNTAGDMLASSPNIYTLTDTIGGNTFKVGTLFLFANNGYYDVAQVVVSQFFVENGRIDTSSSDDKVHVYYRFCRTRNTGSLPTPVGTWTTWTEFSGEGGGSSVTIDTYPTENSANAVSSGGVFERLVDVSPKVDINALDDIDEYSDMLATKSPFYTVTKTTSSVLFRIGTLMVFANQGRYILYQILATDYLLNDDGTLDTTTSINGGLKLIWRMKQFSGNPPAGVTIGAWSAWSYLSGGGGGYQPDNEDIDLNANDQLQFANKAYDASAFSGLGRVYLRKNLVTLEGVGKNTLTQAMVNTANTIYHIQYDYDLNGQTITMPAGCVLEFEGGSLANGVINANGTIINANNPIFNCEITNIGNRETHLQWFIFGDDKQAFLRASKCARSSQGKWLNGDFVTLEITGSVSITEDNDCNLKNVIVNYTATANKESMFLYNTSSKYLAAMTTMENCTFTMLNYTEYSDVHCIHFRLYDLTARGKFSHVYIKNFTGFMFICESYLQETMFEDFRGNRVGGFISFNKEYGTENAYGDFAAGSSNILSFKQCGIDNYLGHNTTIRDVVDITRLIYVYMESCVFQGAVTGVRLTDNCYNFTRYNATYSAKVVIYNCWVEFSEQTLGRCTIGEGMHVISNSERFANNWTIVGSFCTIETPFLRMDNGNIFNIAEGAMPTIKFTGTGSLKNTGLPVKYLQNIANVSFDVSAARTKDSTISNQFYYKPCEYHDLLPNIESIITTAYGETTKSIISVSGARVLRQIPTSTNGLIYFVDKTDWILTNKNPYFNGVYHIVYRVYPLVEVTSENLADFDKAGIGNWYDQFLGSGINPFEVGQSLVPEENEWREVVIGTPQNIYKNYKNSAGKWAMDIAVCESYTTNFNVVRKIFPDPSDATKLVVLEPYDGFENILVGEKQLTSGTTLNTNNSRISFPLKAGTHFVYFDTGGVITDSTMYFRDENNAAIPFSYKGAAQTRTSISTLNLGNPTYQPLTITKDVSYVNFYGGTASADGTIKVWVVLDKLKSYKDKIKELEDRINALEQGGAS